MLDLQEIALECMEELDAIGIEYGNVIEFEINTRAQRRWGAMQSNSGRIFNQYFNQTFAR